MPPGAHGPCRLSKRIDRDARSRRSAGRLCVRVQSITATDIVLPGESVCQALGFDTVWAFELMWRPMQDLTSGRSIALYYYNLAYSLPLYIHIDLRTDNRNAVVFWWNASTCRHLGIGGTHPDPAVRQAQKEGMANYRRLKPYFAVRGILWNR